jgi:hypothetical protein
MNPCGQVVDYLRKCYVARVRPFKGSDQTAVVRWYWAPEGAPTLGGNIWRSAAWYVQDRTGQYPPPPPIGEERSDPFRWSPGRAGQDVALAKCIVGDPSWFATGIPPEALAAPPPPTPACCRVTPALGLGGLLLGGAALRAIFGRGGLLLGGAALPLAITAAQGGLLLGGRETITAAQGGLLLGGHAALEPYVVEGGLLLGGVGRETMALLYCSLRILAAQSIANNTFQTLNWDHVETDPSGMYTGGAPSRITVPVDGVYIVNHVLTYAGMGSGVNVAGILLRNGVGYQQLYGESSAPVAVNENGGTALIQASAGDYLQLQAFQQSGSSQALELSGYIQSSFRVAGLAAPLEPYYCRVHATGSQSIGHSGDVPVTYNVADDDLHGMWSSGHPTRLTAPVAGLYALTASLYYDVAVGFPGDGRIGVYRNGAFLDGIDQVHFLGGALGGVAGAYQARLAAGDYLEVVAGQNSSGTWALHNDGFVRPWAQLSWLGPL